MTQRLSLQECIHRRRRERVLKMVEGTALGEFAAFTMPVIAA